MEDPSSRKARRGTPKLARAASIAAISSSAFVRNCRRKEGHVREELASLDSAHVLRSRRLRQSNNPTTSSRQEGNPGVPIMHGSRPHLEEAAVGRWHPAAARTPASASLLRCFCRCALLLLRGPQKLVVKVGDLGPLEEQVLDEGLEKGAALGRRRRDRQRDGQAGVVHLLPALACPSIAPRGHEGQLLRATGALQHRSPRCDVIEASGSVAVPVGCLNIDIHSLESPPGGAIPPCAESDRSLLICRTHASFLTLTVNCRHHERGRRASRLPGR